MKSNSMVYRFSRFILFCLFVMSVPNSLLGQEGEEQDTPSLEVRIENSRSGSTITLDELVAALGKSDVVFLGEQHDNDSGHKFQLEVIQGLVAAGHSIAITTEQFERDVQGALNDYLSGHLDEAEFLKASRPWKNYSEHYRPIVEFAKQNKIPVIAGNVPRRIATAVSQGKRPAIEDMALMPRHSSTPKNAYWEKFKATMEGHMGADGESKMEKFYASQCLKDDSMAEAIADYLAINSHEPKIVVHLCGHFHSDFGLGTVSRVLHRRPLSHCSVVTMESINKPKSHPKRSNLRDRSHYTFWTIKNSKTE